MFALADAGGDRRARLDDDGHGRHAHGRAASARKPSARSVSAARCSSASCIFAMGLLLGLDTLVSQSFGAGRLDECHRWLRARRRPGLSRRCRSTLVVFASRRRLDRWGLNPDVLRLTRPYLEALAWSLPPLLLYFAFRRYLQGMGVVRPVMIALIAANIVERGRQLDADLRPSRSAGARALRGSAWATVVVPSCHGRRRCSCVIV